MSAVTWLSGQSVLTRRLIAIAVLIAILVTAWIGIVVPLEAMAQGQRAWLSRTRYAIARDRGLIAAQASLREKLASIAHSPLPAKLYPPGPKDTLLAAVQADVGSLLRSAGASTQTITSLPLTSDRYFERAGVRATMSLTVDQLRRLLERLRENPRLIRLEDLIVDAPQTQTGGENPPLAITMSLFGYRLAADSTLAKPIALSTEANRSPDTLIRGVR